MKKQRYDYTGLSWRTLREPRFSHIWLLLGWVVYLLLYALTERLIPPERCHPIHCWLDDVIPFNEYFAVFYVLWFFLVIGSLLYTFLYDVARFRQLQTYFIIVQLVAVAVYLIYPNRQDLRPAAFERDNLFTAVMGLIYAVDTSTGVCPSLHAALSLGILSVGLKDDDMSAAGKGLLTFAAVMICLAVCFVKQHSALDVLAALPLCLLAEILVFGKSYWLPRFSRKG